MNKTDVMEKIYLEYREKVFRYVRGKVASTADAEDVTSEIFWRVLSSLDSYDEEKSTLSVQADKSSHIATYPLLRKPLKTLFGDKLSAEGTTVNTAGMSGGGVEDVLVHMEKDGTHIGKNYALFIRKKMENGLKPNIDYVRSGYELASGKSLLFNTPFYDKLSPYVFYAMNRALLTGGKALIVLGRHGTEEDLHRWCSDGMKEISNIPDLWDISVLDDKPIEEDELPDAGRAPEE